MAAFRLWRRMATLVAFALIAAPAAADDFRPLTEIFRVGAPNQPEADFVYIRCAALIIAKEEWHDRHGTGRPVTRAMLDEARENLRRAEYMHGKMGLKTSPSESVRRAAKADADAYLARFRRNAAGGHQPWQTDRLVAADEFYCKVFAEPA